MNPAAKVPVIKMNLNDTLCEYCYIEKKGYVTVGDVIFFFVVLGVIFSVITALFCGFMYSVYQGLLIIASGKIFDITQQIIASGSYYQVTSLNDRFGILGLIFLTIIAFVFVVACTCRIKIAKCKLGEK